MPFLRPAIPKTRFVGATTRPLQRALTPTVRSQVPTSQNVLQVKQGKRYTFGVVVPWYGEPLVPAGGGVLTETQVGQALALVGVDASAATGWSNFTIWPRSKVPADHPEAAHTHVVLATRVGPDGAMDLSQPPYAGLVLWGYEAYGNLPLPPAGGGTGPVIDPPVEGGITVGKPEEKKIPSWVWWAGGAGAAALVLFVATKKERPSYASNPRRRRRRRRR